MIFNKFCESKMCEHMIEWELDLGEGNQPYICTSCKLVGQSYEIDEYPKDCPYLKEIKEYETRGKV